MKEQKKNKITIKILKSLAIIILIFSMLNGVFAQVVSDNDENAFITKAELNTLKKAYQTKLTNLLTNVDKNIDNIEIEYLRKYVKTAQSKECPYPIGAIYISTNGMNPGNLIGGEWEEFGKGKTLVGFSSGDTDYNTVLKTGGEKEHTMTLDELPSHTHTYSASFSNDLETSSTGSHTHKWAYDKLKVKRETAGRGYLQGATSGTLNNESSRDGDHNHTFTPAGQLLQSGSSTPFNIMQPYIVVSFWHRVA